MKRVMFFAGVGALAGATWLMALERLAHLYGYDVAARAQPDGTDALLVAEKAPADATVWSYGEELDALEVVHGGDRANHILVYGAPGSPAINQAMTQQPGAFMLESVSRSATRLVGYSSTVAARAPHGERIGL